MTEMQWQRVELLFHQALSLQGEEREKFLAEACHGDPALYQEVCSLLSNYHSQDELLEKAAGAPIEDELAAGAAPRKAREKIGPYEVISLLGRGGMGEVYLARDPRLKRKVAIKILPRSVAGNRDLMDRLRKEALAASALNHPNILTIYEFGQQDDAQYIVSEYVEGTSLRDEIGRLSTGQALEYARQTGQALAAAHAAGIIHRDIKPENIMVRADGYIKVLDFGLAKVIDAQMETASLHERISIPGTVPGALIGTLNYMSPEQVEGHPVDQRSDIWSWGVVLYEMLAGRRPFVRDTPGGIVAAILSQNPAPSSTDERLNQVVAKALAKKAEERYANMPQALSDLSRVATAAAILLAEARKSLQGDRTSARTKWVWSLAGVLTIALVFLAAILFRSGIWPVTKQAFNSIQVTRLTTTGEAQVAAISPDGRYVAYAIDEGSKQSLWLRQLGTGVSTEIMPADATAYWGLTFSPDGNFIAFTRSEKDRPLIKSVYEIATLGGTPRKLISDVGQAPISFSPDGRQIAFVRPNRQGTADWLIVANGDGSGERTLASNASAPAQPAWSPDGHLIAVNTLPSRQVGVVATTGGPVKLLTSKNWLFANRTAWLPDGKGLIVAAADAGSPDLQLWRVSYPQGETRRLTNDPNDYFGMSLTADGKNLVTVARAAPAAMFVVSAGEASPARKIAAGAADYRFVLGLDWTRDGRIVYVSKASGNLDLWMMDADGSHAQQLVADGVAHSWVAVADDGTAAFSSSGAQGATALSIMNLAEHNIQLATDKFSGCQDISRDGRWIVYAYSPGGGPAHLLKLPARGGAPVQLADGIQCFPRISPDGKLVAYNYFDVQAQRRRTAVISLDGGPALATVDLPQDTTWNGKSLFQWTPDGKALTYPDTKDGIDNLWNQPLDGGPPKQVTHFTSDRIFSFSWSRDGKRLAVSRGTRTSDVVLIRSVD
jgi:serine/threonine protein kinase/Tol biopolymer transport system component